MLLKREFILQLTEQGDYAASVANMDNEKRTDIVGQSIGLMFLGARKKVNHNVMYLSFCYE